MPDTPLGRLGPAAAARPLLVVVTGPPAAGKSTLARELAARTRVPLFEKDGIKEILFDELGTGDRDWSRRLGHATFPLLYDAIARLLSAGASLIAEANFAAGTAEHDFAELPAHRILQVHVDAPAEILRRRASTRVSDGTRHPGHHSGTLSRHEVEAALRDGRWSPLELPGRLVSIDTANGTDVAGLAALVTTELASEGSA